MQVPRPLDNPLIFGNFYVAFSSTQRTSQQNSQRMLPGPFMFIRKHCVCWLFIAVSEHIHRVLHEISKSSALSVCGAAAGGNFRSKPGRLLFQTKELCQSIFKPDLATNKVHA